MNGDKAHTVRYTMLREYVAATQPNLVPAAYMLTAGDINKTELQAN
jgi:hypothetical protein